MAQKRSDKANYLALLVLGIALLALIGVTSGATGPLAVICLVGAAIYYWKVERSESP